MIKGTGVGGALHLSIDGSPIGVLDGHKLEFTLNEQTYTVRRIGPFSPRYELLCGTAVLASIRQSLFVSRYTLGSAGREWMLKPDQMIGKQHALFDGDAKVGSITPSSRIRYRDDITIDLPDELPLEAQAFLMWLLLWKWDDTST
jgi:hypothetical protein